MLGRKGYIDLFDWNDDIYSYYYDGYLYKEEQLPSDINFTYEYNHHLNGHDDITIINIFNKNKSLNSYFRKKTQLKKFYSLNHQIESFKKTYQSTDTNIFNLTLIDLIPKTLLTDYLRIKHEIVNEIYQQESRPSDYDILKKIVMVTKQIESQQLKLKFKDDFDYGRLRKEVKHNISYNPFVGITGRMGLNPNHFPILNLKKDKRHIIQTKYGSLLEFDFNSSEIRVCLSLSGQEQPNIDIHDWHNQEKFAGKKTREEMKIDFFGWLYSPLKKDDFYEQYYNKELLIDKYFDQEKNIVKTDFGREIKTTDKKWLSYLLQSTASDMFFECAFNIFQQIKKKKNIEMSFVLHDAIVIDLNEQKHPTLPQQIGSIFSQTRYGQYPINILKGKNFGEMK